MLKQTITFTDYNGVERTEDFFFNLTKAELVKMEMSEAGGFSQRIEKIVAAQDGPAVMEVFRDLISKAYGEKSADGKRFVKSPELSQAFAETEAYSELFMKLVTDADAASAFIKGILPVVEQ